MFGLKGKKLGALSRRDAGQTLVETALCMSIFILLLFGALDIGYWFYAKVTLQNAVRQGARYAVTGNCISGACFSGTNQSNRVDSIISTVNYYSFNLAPTVTLSCSPASGSGSCSTSYESGSNNAGGPGDFVTVSATYTSFTPIVLWRWGQSIFTFTVSSSFKNESFNPAPTGGS